MVIGLRKCPETFRYRSATVSGSHGLPHLQAADIPETRVRRSISVYIKKSISVIPPSNASFRTLNRETP